MEWHGLLYLGTNKVECEGDFVESHHEEKSVGVRVHEKRQLG